MGFNEELDILMRARCTLMVLVTPEEERALAAVKGACERSTRECYSWDLSDDFQLVSGNGKLPAGAPDPKTALERIDKADGGALYVLKDFHDAWTNTVVKRKLRSVAQRLKFTRKSILVTCPARAIPDELKDEAVIIDFAPPDAPQIEVVLDGVTATPGVQVNLTTLGREKMVQAALGLTASQAQRVFAKAVVRDGVLDDRDIAAVTEEKKQVIRESEALEFYSVTETADDVGGLDVLKHWLEQRERAFTQEARDYGLPAPKGIALIGIPGTGKSLTAKTTASIYGLPLLRLDIGALLSSGLGESDKAVRRA